MRTFSPFRSLSRPASLALAVSALLGFSGCAGCDPEPAPGDGGGSADAGDGGGGGGTGRVVVNEFLALNENGATDEAGEHEDWVELYNAGDAVVDLSGYGLSDDPNEPGRFRFPEGTKIAPGEFLLVWTDGHPDQGPLHTSFRLSGDGEAVVLTDADGAVIDDVRFGPQRDDISMGRYPDGEGEVVTLLSPTPGAPNTRPREPSDETDGGLPEVAPLINEVKGAPGAFVELYNPHDEEVGLAGLYLSPNPVTPTRWAIPEGTPALAPGGYAVFLLDGDDAAGPDHTSFAFNAPGTILLAATGGVALEQVNVPALDEDESWARLPDGEGAFAKATPTAGEANEPLVDAGPPPEDGGPDAGDDDAGDDDAGNEDAGNEDAGNDDAGSEDAGDAGDAG